MRRILIISAEDGLWRARELGDGLAQQGLDVGYAPVVSTQSHWDAAQSPDVIVCVGWENLAVIGRAPCPLVLDLPVPRLAGERPGPDLARGVEAKLAALRLADYYTCAGPHQRLYFRSWLALAEIPQADSRLAVIPARQMIHPGAVPDYLAPAVVLQASAVAVAPLAQFVQEARVLPAPTAPAVAPGMPAPERLKRPRQLLGEVRYHYRYGGLRAVWTNSLGFAGKVLRRILHRL